MNLQQQLEQRSGEICELCSSVQNLKVYSIQPETDDPLQHHILVCETCEEQLMDPEKNDPNHWRCLNDSIWSEHRPVKVIAWRKLNELKSEAWPMDLLNMMYMDDEDLAYAQAGNTIEASAVVHKDCNGVVLQAGDSVVLIKDLKVKGSSMVAKQGTAVRRISLDHENEKFIEGKVDGQTIVIITDYVKKI
ncbi:MAG: PhnA domain-containing protein [Flavobacteriaceae bacterium]|nr:PhnA domain-containing protein [Flavobacteriaceae bacterium]